MSKLVLIENLLPTAAKIVTEKKDKDYYIDGIFMQSDIVNGNGRIYPFEEIKRAVDKVNKCIKDGVSIMGELNHPDNLSINLDRVSHVFTQMKMVGKNAVGRAKLISGMPTAEYTKILLDHGIKLGVSSRGSGVVDSNGYVDDFDFVTADIVANPSAPDAYPEYIRESINNLPNDNRTVMTLAEAACVDPRAQEYLKNEVLKFITGLINKTNYK